jgi:hypothetical protein
LKLKHNLKFISVAISFLSSTSRNCSHELYTRSEERIIINGGNYIATGVSPFLIQILSPSSTLWCI